MKPPTQVREERGFILFGVTMLMAVILIIAPFMVKWLQQEGRWASKEQKNLSAYNLAEAGLDRGQWMLKSATYTWKSAQRGAVVPGYNFDRTYTDAGAGWYRIRFSSGPGDREVTILSEGRHPLSGETRAIRASYINSAIPGPLLSRGNITLDGNFYVHWGAVASQGSIYLGNAPDADADRAAGRPYPRKLARLVVKSSSSVTAFTRDPDGGIGGTNSAGPTGDWFSNSTVVNLPRLDFETLRSSAIATGTLNCYGRFAGYPEDMRDDNAPYQPYRTDSGYNGANESVFWHNTNAGGVAHRDWTTAGNYKRWRTTRDGHGYNPVLVRFPPAANWNTAGVIGASQTGFPETQLPCHEFYCGAGNTDPNCATLPTGAERVVEGLFFDSRADDGIVWYWDGNPLVPADQVRIYDSGARGTFIVRGPALLGGDDLDRLDTPLKPSWNAHEILVPSDAWKEYQRPGPPAFNTTAPNEYPGDPGGDPEDIGDNTFYTLTPSGAPIPLRRIDGTTDNFQIGGDLAFSGLLYVGGDLAIQWAPEIYGAIWVDGAINSTTQDLAAVFYDSSLEIPVLDVVLSNQSWVEVSPSTNTWVP